MKSDVTEKLKERLEARKSRQFKSSFEYLVSLVLIETSMGDSVLDAPIPFILKLSDILVKKNKKNNN